MAAMPLHLAGLADPTGQHLENLVLTDLLAWAWILSPQPEVMHWRTTRGGLRPHPGGRCFERSFRRVFSRLQPVQPHLLDQTRRLHHALETDRWDFSRLLQVGVEVPG